MLSFAEMTGYACVFMRMTGCIMLNPIIGRRTVPGMFKAGLIMMLSLLIFTYEMPQVPNETELFSLTLILLSELFMGFVLGFVVTLFTYVIIMGGQIIDMQMGLSMSNIYDPGSNISMSLTTTFYNIMFMVVFFSINGHLTLIEMFLTSGDVVPYGQATFLNPNVGDSILDLFLLCTELGIKFAFPVLAIQILVEIAVGLLMKTIPQINVFVVNLQIKILLGLFTLIVIFTPMSQFVDRLIVTMLQAVEEVLMLM